MANQETESAIPMTRRVWPLPDELALQTCSLADLRARIRDVFENARVDPVIARQYEELLLGAGFLGCASPLIHSGDWAEKASNFGQPAEIITRRRAVPSLLSDLSNSLGQAVPVRHFAALVDLWHYSPQRALITSDAHRDLPADEVIDPLIDAVVSLQGGGDFTDALLALADTRYLERRYEEVYRTDPAFHQLLNRLTQRRLLQPELIVEALAATSQLEGPWAAPASRRRYYEASYSPRRFEFWFRHFGGHAFDLLHELWLGLSDNELVRALRRAMDADQFVATYHTQDIKESEHANACREFGATLAMRDTATELRETLPAAVNALGRLAAISEPESPRQRRAQQKPGIELLQEAATEIEQLTKTSDASALKAVQAHLRKMSELISRERKPAAGPSADGIENLVVHLDERVQRGAKKDLKALFVHFGALLLKRLHQLSGYGLRWLHPPDLDMFGEYESTVLGRTGPGQRGDVEKRLGEAAVHALADLRALSSKANEPAAAQEFAERWPEFDEQLTVTHQCGSLWQFVKVLLLTIHNIGECSVPCAGADLRYASPAKSTEPEWLILADCLGTRLRAALDNEQTKDALLLELRTSWAKFLLDRLLPPKGRNKDGAVGTPLEASETFRLSHVRALKHLKVNPEGKGHRILHRVAEQDPSPVVRNEAKAVYSLMRRWDGVVGPETARRSVFAAFYLFREAQVRLAGGEVAARASRTWYNEARSARNDYEWFSKRTSVKH